MTKKANRGKFIGSPAHIVAGIKLEHRLMENQFEYIVNNYIIPKKSNFCGYQINRLPETRN